MKTYKYCQKCYDERYTNDLQWTFDHGNYDKTNLVQSKDCDHCHPKKKGKGRSK